MHKTFGVLAALLGLLAVAFGAFGAHELADRLAPQLLVAFQSAARMQMYHALALLAVAAALARAPSPPLRAAGWLFFSGTVIFSGSLYVYALSGRAWTATVTPVGGVLLLLGWATLAFAWWRS
ncbi:MAG TPA: DUF423 domain-containing protein [Gemmatimonadales bacterium]|nr:DUF423 domain-containing protein [Gemmatimonadales bacterium]